MQSYYQFRRLRQEVQEDLNAARRATISTSTSEAKGTTIDPGLVPGVTVSRADEEGNDSTVYVVGWKDNDPSNPLSWSMPKKWLAMTTCCFLGIAFTIPSSIEGPVQPAFDEHFGVSPMAGSMTTGIFLIGVGVGSLFSGPFSETFGRNIVYFVSMTVVMLFIMGKALAPNYGAALAFRFLCALFAATPMTVAGGTIGDIWSPLQIPFSLPLVTICAYAGPILGPVIGAYTPEIGFEWADWISMIIIGAVLVFVLIAQPETYSPLLLEWRAQHLRQLTGDSRYQAQHTSASSLGSRLLTNVYRPFVMIWTEPIIIVFTFYLVLLYFVLFTFLNGYTYIFTQPYDISLSLTFILWVAMMPGVVVALAMVPYIYHLTNKTAAKAMAEGKPLQPEVSLYWAMAGASILMPVSLFWMAWTCYPEISIWSPILASSVFGYALVCIFTTSYMYIIFVYLQYAASALGFMTFARYLVSGALSPASIKMYDNIGPHWSLTIVAIIATFMAPVPYVLHRHGHKVRAMSRNVQNRA
ncbi:major facilitator superfamily domain-containing protein [Aspergillus pseudoustus]|uniref:Major facilitator superfamily domain-containing protein n=1 Tax=Aspergillus pseudoustus TaxID=1810923 RepID=A0ABR4IQX6_9EURO